MLSTAALSFSVSLPVVQRPNPQAARLPLLLVHSKQAGQAQGQAPRARRQRGGRGSGQEVAEHRPRAAGKVQAALQAAEGEVPRKPGELLCGAPRR